MDDRDDPLPAGWLDAPVAIERLSGRYADGTEWSYDVDTALWVELDGERGYIVGNAHTHRGRFRVCFPERTEWVAMPTSVYELSAMSRRPATGSGAS